MPSSDKHVSSHKRDTSSGPGYERRAAYFFEQHGFEILERNWRGGRLEIDLIVRKEDLIVFVEVKSVSSDRYGHPAEKVDKRKISRLTRAAQKYLLGRNVGSCDLRFDVVTFVKGRLEHFPGAFEASQ